MVNFTMEEKKEILKNQNDYPVLSELIKRQNRATFDDVAREE